MILLKFWPSNTTYELDNVVLYVCRPNNLQQRVFLFLSELPYHQCLVSHTHDSWNEDYSVILQCFFLSCSLISPTIAEATRVVSASFVEKLFPVSLQWCGFMEVSS